MATNPHDTELLRSSRKALGFSQQRLADVLRVRHGQLLYWESGRCAIPAAILASVWHASKALTSGGERVAHRILCDGGDAYRHRRPFVLREQLERQAEEQLDIFDGLYPAERSEQLAFLRGEPVR